jgi:hypothetical protein
MAFDWTLDTKVGLLELNTEFNIQKASGQNFSWTAMK